MPASTKNLVSTRLVIRISRADWVAVCRDANHRRRPLMGIKRSREIKEEPRGGGLEIIQNTPLRWTVDDDDVASVSYGDGCERISF